MKLWDDFVSFLTRKRSLRKNYNTRQLLNAFTHEILTVLDLQELMEVTVSDLMHIMKLESAGILLHNKYVKEYSLAAGSGLKSRELRFSDQDVLIQYLAASGQPVLLDKRTEKHKRTGPLHESFQRLNAHLCLPLQIHNELIGVLFLGEKKSGEDFSQEDLEVLSALCRTEAIAISNAQLFSELSKMQNQMVQKEKMAVIGTLAAGINHEICNPLSIIRGECEIFLLNYRDNFYKDKSHEEMIAMFHEIMKKVVRETDRAAAITKRLSSFAKPSSHFHEEPISIEKEIGEVLGLMSHDITRKNITVRKQFSEDFPAILTDRKQIDEALFNVLRNSVQLSDKPEGLITITGETEGEDFAVVCVQDNGKGMPAEKIANIFNPFYISREPGKGTDLGLFIVKQIMEQQKGSIVVQSNEGSGTVFVLRFPVKKK